LFVEERVHDDINRLESLMDLVIENIVLEYFFFPRLTARSAGAGGGTRVRVSLATCVCACVCAAAAGV